MSIVVHFLPASLTAQQYDEAIRRLEQDGGDWPADGLEYHVCFGADGKMRVTEVWDSPQQFETFGERLMPLLADVGIEPGEPEVVEVHNIVQR